MPHALCSRVPRVDFAKLTVEGRLAQLGEHQLDKLGVTGSSPVPPTSQSPALAGFSLASSGHNRVTRFAYQQDVSEPV
jgi:hypothetical protein